MSGYVYYISSELSERVKIGFTRHNPERRLRELQTGSPYELCIVAAEPGTERDEKELHERFADFRLHGEWFRADFELAQHIVDVNRRTYTQAEERQVMPPRWARIQRAFDHGATLEEAQRA